MGYGPEKGTQVGRNRIHHSELGSSSAAIGGTIVGCVPLLISNEEVSDQVPRNSTQFKHSVTLKWTNCLLTQPKRS